MAKFRRMSLYRLSYNDLKPLLEARVEYLNMALDEIYNWYGLIKKYLIKHCGLETDVIPKVKSLITNN